MVNIFTTDKREMVLWGKEEIKKFVAFPWAYALAA